MVSRWEIEKFSGNDDFGLWKIKMQVILIQEMCIDALKNEAFMLARLTQVQNTEMLDKSLAHRLYLKQQLYSFRMGEKKSIIEQLMEFHKIIDDLKNIEMNIDDEDNALLLLSSLPRSFEHFKDALLYGNEDTIILDEVQTVMKSKEFSKLKDLKIEDSGEGLNVSRGGGERK
ncbi:uncharacterized protein LOC131620136 [Vicia villosa]|uniref:uncharacterized protein LOC131620136 n=1 Tax=Vicia villosa TaxID=3911 RepID=UPI00273B72D0|nr:uncharacterized protein LOC131620136 [Vicia villosa]